MKVIVLNEFNQCVWKMESPEASLEAVYDEDEPYIGVVGGTSSGKTWNSLMSGERQHQKKYRLNLGDAIVMKYYEDNDTRGPGNNRTPFGADRVRI